MRICAECGGGSFELDEQEQLFCAHCGSVSIETQLAIDVGDESVLLSGSRRRLRRFQRENDGGKRIRKEDINTSRKRSRRGSKEKERLRSGVERAQQAASLFQSTLQSEANTFFNYLSFHFLQKEDHESMRRQYLDTLRATWVGYVETYIWLFDSRFLPSENYSVALLYMVARDILRLPVTHEIVTAWISRRQQSNVRRGTLTRDIRIASTYEISWRHSLGISLSDKCLWYHILLTKQWLEIATESPLTWITKGVSLHQLLVRPLHLKTSLNWYLMTNLCPAMNLESNSNNLDYSWKECMCVWGVITY